jgi:hypothetical protein
VAGTFGGYAEYHCSEEGETVGWVYQILVAAIVLESPLVSAGAWLAAVLS